MIWVVAKSKLFIFFSTLFLGISIFVNDVYGGVNSFITIVNPVRISAYTPDPYKSISTQYGVVKDYGLSATWLLTFDVMNNSELVKIFKDMDDNQELGLFMEVTPMLADKSGVLYPSGSSWHHANAVFLTGYKKEDRQKIIDTLFERFKEIFDYYPNSVGAWWIDSYSLKYMHDKYGVVANLTCADQFETDGYQIWGTYWSTPYYPSIRHAGLPADEKSKIGVVSIQWAHRDPLNGYNSSLFSTQDYFVPFAGQGIEYFEKLVSLYTDLNHNNFGHITLGLEGDLSEEAYLGTYMNQLGVAKRFLDNGGVQIKNMSDFAKWYLENFRSTPDHVIYSHDLLDENKEVLWYQSNKYRIGLVREEDKTYVFDLRTYQKDLKEPYFDQVNRQLKLHINMPSVIDTKSNSREKWFIKEGEWEFDSKARVLNIRDLTIFFEEENFVINSSSVELPEIIRLNKLLNISEKEKKISIRPANSWLTNTEGFTFRDFKIEFYYWFKSKKNLMFLFIFALLVVFLFYILLKVSMNKRVKGLFLFLYFSFLLSLFIFLYYKNTNVFYVSQSELDTLHRLSLMEDGLVLVYDKECLGCEWHSRYMPAVYANKRDYISKISGKKIVKNNSVFDSNSQAEAKEEFAKLHVKYIYVTKYDKNIESPPFSPGDLGIEKIYENAHSALWKVI